MDDLIYQSARSLAQAIRSKDISSEEIVTACINRVEQVNPQLNAVVQLRTDQAFDEARQADAALARGEVKGPLHGLPMMIKDSLDTAGVISTGGTQGRAMFIPEQDATVVARLKDAGAILLGKTNTPELTLSYETDNLIYGRTNNPYDLSRTSGGSSGGAAAIVASGGSPFDIGSDYGGSIRIPSHFCGLAGIKPTSGRVPRTGHIIPFAAGATDSFQQLGPIARTVEDLILLLPIIAGPDWCDPAIIPMPWFSPIQVDLQALKVGFHIDNGIAIPSPETIQTIQNVVTALQDHVTLVEERQLENLQRTASLWFELVGADRGNAYFDIIGQAATEQISPNLQWILNLEAVSGEAFGDLIRELDRFRSQMLTFMADYDVMICPVDANPAFLHAEQTETLGSYTRPYNLTGWPGTVVRAGTSPEGLPIGVQILSKPWREDITLAVAQFVETTFGGWQPPAL